MNTIAIDSPIGQLTLIGTNKALTSICFGVSSYTQPVGAALRAVRSWVEYLRESGGIS